MIQPTPMPPSARIAAKLRVRERWTLILTVSIGISLTVLFLLFPPRSTPPRRRSRAERAQLLQSGTCIVQDGNGALLGKLIMQLPPSRIPARYVIDDPRVRSTRTIDISGTRRVSCSSIHEP